MSILIIEVKMKLLLQVAMLAVWSVIHAGCLPHRDIPVPPEHGRDNGVKNGDSITSSSFSLIHTDHSFEMSKSSSSQTNLYRSTQRDFTRSEVEPDRAIPKAELEAVRQSEVSEIAGKNLHQKHVRVKLTDTASTSSSAASISSPSLTAPEFKEDASSDSHPPSEDLNSSPSSSSNSAETKFKPDSPSLNAGEKENVMKRILEILHELGSLDTEHSQRKEDGDDSSEQQDDKDAKDDYRVVSSRDLGRSASRRRAVARISDQTLTRIRTVRPIVATLKPRPKDDNGGDSKEEVTLLPRIKITRAVLIRTLFTRSTPTTHVSSDFSGTRSLHHKTLASRGLNRTPRSTPPRTGTCPKRSELQEIKRQVQSLPKPELQRILRCLTILKNQVTTTTAAPRRSQTGRSSRAREASDVRARDLMIIG